MRVRADEMQLLEGIGAGDIGAIVGLKAIRSGDTIVADDDKEAHGLQMVGVTVPPPVFFCSIEPETSREKNELFTILHNMSREDPSLAVHEDEETGQVLVSGLGELHLEILRDRIELEYGIKAELGRMRVAYRESIIDAAEEEVELEKTIGGAHMYCKLKIRVESTLGDVDVTEMQRDQFAAEDGTGDLTGLSENQVLFDFEDLEPVVERVKLEGDEYEKSKRRANKEELTSQAAMEIYRSLDSLPADHKETMRFSLEDALESGQLLGYPMVNARVRVLDGRWSNLRSRNALIF